MNAIDANNASRKKGIECECKPLLFNLAKMFFVLAIILAFGCLSLLGVIPVLLTKVDVIYSQEIVKNLAIRNGSILHQMLTKSSKTTREIYFYPILNQQDLLTVKKVDRVIAVSQEGPFVYEKHTIIKDPEFLNDGKSFAYTPYTYLEPNVTKSVSDPSYTYVTLINMIEIATYETMNEIAQATLSGLFIKKSIKEFLFGFYDGVAHYLVSDESVGFMKETQNKLGKRVQINTGIEDIKKLGQIEKIDGKSYVTGWEAPMDNEIHGTEGAFFHPNIQKDEILEVFVSPLCRSILFEFEKEESAWNDKRVMLYKFRAMEKNFLEDPQKIHYCAFDRLIKDTCSTNGMIDLLPCRKPTKYSPIFMSLQNFYTVDKHYKNLVKGLKKASPNDTIQIWVEPVTGVTLQAIKKFMVNLYYHSFDEYQYFSGFRGEYFLPILSFMEKEQATEKQLDDLYKKLSMKDHYKIPLTKMKILLMKVLIGAIAFAVALLIPVFWQSIRALCKTCRPKEFMKRLKYSMQKPKELMKRMKHVSVPKPWKKRA